MLAFFAGLFVITGALATTGLSAMLFEWAAPVLKSGILLFSVVVAALSNIVSNVPAVLLLRWLVFRLNYQSGVAKIRSGDRTWQDRTACCYHFATQPLPDLGGPLWAVYLAWFLSLLAIYPLCRWFAGVKARRRDWWLSYL